MGILDELLGGGNRQREYSDFVNRYEQGHPAEGYSDEEVIQRYGDVAHAVPAEDYAQAAQEALARLSPEERAAFVKMLQERAQARGTQLPEQVTPDPGDLGRVLTDVHQTPGALRDMLAGASPQQPPPGGASALQNVLGSPLARAALAGITAMIVKRVMRGTGG